MSLETTSETASTGYVTVAKDKWPSFFDGFTKLLEGRSVEIEVAGLDLGDQIEAEWLTLSGLTYDRKAGAFYVYIEDGDRDMAHAIHDPREIVVHLDASGLDQVAVTDAEGRVHVVRLRGPIGLPAAT